MVIHMGISCNSMHTTPDILDLAGSHWHLMHSDLDTEQLFSSGTLAWCCTHTVQLLDLGADDIQKARA